jgi:hypothetical protein
MAVKGWFDLTTEKQREAFLNLRHHDIGELKLTLTALANLLARFDLLDDPEIRQHFEEEKIPLPPAVTKETGH